MTASPGGHSSRAEQCAQVTHRHVCRIPGCQMVDGAPVCRSVQRRDAPPPACALAVKGCMLCGALSLVSTAATAQAFRLTLSKNSDWGLPVEMYCVSVKRRAEGMPRSTTSASFGSCLMASTASLKDILRSRPELTPTLNEEAAPERFCRQNRLE